MNGVEAAASLFGPDDSSSDPFASLGTDGVTTSGNDMFHDYGAPPAEAQDSFAVPSGSTNEVQPEESSSHLYALAQRDSFQATEHYESSGVPGQSQSWYSAEEDGNVNLQQSHPINDSYWPAYSTASEPIKATPPRNAYDPYHPSSTGNAYMSAYTPSSSNTDYSPYNPPLAPTTQPTVTQQSSPYTPTTSGQYSTQTPSSYKPLVASNIRVPTTPAPATTVTRPKISNAYDPPFPPVAKSKRVVSRSGLGQSVTTAYSSYQASVAYSSQDAPFNHGQAHAIVPSVPASTPSFGGLPQQGYGNYSSDDVYSVGNMGHQVPPVQGYHATNGHQEQNATFDSATWTTKGNGYHPQGKIEQLNQFMDTVDGARTWHHTTPSSLPTGNNITQMDEYRSDLFSSRETELENRMDLQADAMNQTGPLKAHASPDFGVARVSSPETLANRMPPASLDPSAQLSRPFHEVIGSEVTTNTSTHQYDYDPRGPKSRTVVSSHAPKSPETYGPPKGNRYTINSEEHRAASPGSQSVRSLNGRQSTAKPPVSGQPPSRIENLRDRSSSNSSLLGQPYPEGPYAPQMYPKAQLPVAEAGVMSHNPSLANLPAYPTYGSPAAPTQPQYAPSPSLIGSNDPLGRTSSRAPVVSFGFGGKVVACFHGLTTLNTGFDVALSSRKTTDIQIYNLTKVVPRSALDIPVTTFPGPLFSDPGTITTSLVRTGTAGQKNKKAGIVKYLTERADEISHGLGYLSPGSPERRQAEGKLILVKILRVMVENDGRLSGSPSIDANVRTALVPRLDGTLTSPTPEFKTIADAQTVRSDITSVPDPETIIAVSTLRSSSLDKIQEFLLRGERRQAYSYALDEKLWAHAMIIASSIDKDAWKEVVNEFLKAELATKDEGVYERSYPRMKDTLVSLTNGREGLRVAYSLFSGQGSVAIQELVPQNTLGRGAAKLQSVPPAAHLTPRTPNFQPPAPPANIPSETLMKWAEIVAMMISSTMTTDTSSALTALGDQLLANQYIEAAHVCYLLAPQTSLMGGLGNPAVRIVLVGSKTPALVPNFAADLDPIIFTEIVEFALSLSPAGKGQDAFAGLPHLQAFKFFRAISLAEVGEMQLANRYCEAITASLGRHSPYFTPALLEQLKGLMDRISGTSHVDRSSSWMGSKIGKPSLDSIGGWLEGRIAKFVAGDADSPIQPQDMTRMEERTFSGPFSTISSATPSARSSPQPTPISNVAPPPRSGSAMAFPSQNVYIPIDRASSALDHYKPKVASTPRVASASAVVSSFSQTLTQGLNMNDLPQNAHGTEADTLTPKVTSDENFDEQEPAWWGSSSSYDNSTKTPTATNFMRVEESVVTTTAEGFISLMDTPAFSNITPNTTHESPAHSLPAPEEDVEDLGFGNTKKEMKITDNRSNTAEPVHHVESQNKAEPAKTDPGLPTAASGSWFSRWWSREQATGPVRASLGEESTFYYDKELKRWVNKKVGSEDTGTKSVLQPPPTRAQTASPGMTGPRLTTMKPPSTQTHSTSAIDLSTSPPSKSTLSVQSNIAPPVLDSAPSTPTGTRVNGGGPPPNRPKSQTTARRNLRSRYVDILQSEGGNSQ